MPRNTAFILAGDITLAQAKTFAQALLATGRTEEVSLTKKLTQARRIGSLKMSSSICRRQAKPR